MNAQRAARAHKLGARKSWCRSHGISSIFHSSLSLSLIPRVYARRAIYTYTYILAWLSESESKSNCKFAETLVYYKYVAFEIWRARARRDIYLRLANRILKAIAYNLRFIKIIAAQSSRISSAYYIGILDKFIHRERRFRSILIALVEFATRYNIYRHKRVYIFLCAVPI